MKHRVFKSGDVVVIHAPWHWADEKGECMWHGALGIIRKKLDIRNHWIVQISEFSRGDYLLWVNKNDMEKIGKE
jgi:hypothetical protein